MFAFRETDYYQATMGDAINKVFFVFEELFDPAEFVDAKLQTGDWEHQYAASAGHEEQRPLNLDPGYLTSAKLVLGLDQGPCASHLPLAGRSMPK